MSDNKKTLKQIKAEIKKKGLQPKVPYAGHDYYGSPASKQRPDNPGDGNGNGT